MKTAVLTRQLFILSMIFLAGCSGQKSEPKEESPSTAEKSSSTFNSDEEVKSYLEDKGLLMAINGREVYREDNAAGMAYQDIVGSIKTLSSNPEENSIPLFYLKVIGANLEDSEERQSFIEGQMANKDLYLHMEKMMRFLQRQDRPVIKSALLNVTDQITEDQCVEFLQHLGYLSGTAAGSFTYDERVLKTIPTFYKVALLDKLRGAEGRAGMVYDQMALSLGVS